MKSKIFQLMLLFGALTVSFAAQAADVNNKNNERSSLRQNIWAMPLKARP